MNQREEELGVIGLGENEEELRREKKRNEEGKCRAPHTPTLTLTKATIICWVCFVKKE